MRTRSVIIFFDYHDRLLGHTRLTNFSRVAPSTSTPAASLAAPVHLMMC